MKSYTTQKRRRCLELKAFCRVWFLCIKLLFDLFVCITVKKWRLLPFRCRLRFIFQLQGKVRFDSCSVMPLKSVGNTKGKDTSLTKRRIKNQYFVVCLGVVLVYCGYPSLLVLQSSINIVDGLGKEIYFSKNQCANQTRRQDLAAGGDKNQKEGPKTGRGGHIFKIHCWIYAATGGPNVKWGGTDFKWGAGHHCPPPRWWRPWCKHSLRICAVRLGEDWAAVSSATRQYVNKPIHQRCFSDVSIGWHGS